MWIVVTKRLVLQCSDKHWLAFVAVSQQNFVQPATSLLIRVPYHWFLHRVYKQQMRHHNYACSERTHVLTAQCGSVSLLVTHTVHTDGNGVVFVIQHLDWCQKVAWHRGRVETKWIELRYTSTIRMCGFTCFSESSKERLKPALTCLPTSNQFLAASGCIVLETGAVVGLQHITTIHITSQMLMLLLWCNFTNLACIVTIVTSSRPPIVLIVHIVMIHIQIICWCICIW